jgi:DNA-binding winged helix-turn-helix (wHTH) protein
LSSNAHFVIDSKVKFYFDQTQQTLHSGDEIVPLQRREAQTLCCILDTSRDTTKPDEIAVYLWGEGPVNDDYANKKSQAITHVSKIRKRLEQLGVAADWLQTRGALGYQVCCEVEFVSNEAQHQELIKRRQWRKVRAHWFKVTKYSGLSALLTTVVFGLIYFVSSQPSVTLNNVRQLHTLSGVSIEPSFSPNSDAIAFSYQISTSSGRIYLKANSDINYRALTSKHFDQSPSFSPSGRQLAFQRKLKEGCEIRLIQLDAQYNKVGDDVKIAQCSAKTWLSSITWLAEDKLLFTDKHPKTGLSAIYQLNLVNQKKSLYLQIDDVNYYGAGYYYLTFDSKSQRLYVLDGENWSTTNIYQLDVNKVLSKIATIKNSLSSVALLDDKLIFKDLDNRLKSLSVSDPQQIDLVYWDPLNPISYPVTDSSYQRLAFVSGEYYRSRVHTYSLDDGVDSEMISSKFKLRLPIASENEVLVTSSESGITQVYTYKNNFRQQLSDFKINRKIVNVATSANQKWLAVSFIDGSTLYKRSDKGLVQVRHFALLSFPGFSLNSQRLLLSDVADDDVNKHQVVEYDLQKYFTKGIIEPTHINLKKVKFAVYHELGIIYVPSNKPGVYLLTRNSDEALNNTIVAVYPAGFGLTDTHLYVATADRKLVSIDLKTSQVKHLPDHLFGVFSIDQNKLFYIVESLGHTDIVVADVFNN